MWNLGCFRKQWLMLGAEQTHPINSQVEQWLYLAKFATPWWHASFLSMVLLLQDVECTHLIEPAHVGYCQGKIHWWKQNKTLKMMHTVCVMKIFPVEFTDSSRSRFSLLPWSSELEGGKSRKQIKENVRGATACVVHDLLQVFSWYNADT